jgi:hypothetical protein
MSEPLRIGLAQTLTGDREKIIATLTGLAELLQTEVDARAERASDRTPGTTVDGPRLVDIIVEQVSWLKYVFIMADQSFNLAVAPGGSPDVIRQAYAGFLENILSARSAIWAVEAPRSFARSQRSFRDFISSLYLQVASWPKQFRDAAASVSGDSFDMAVWAECDVSTAVRAVEEEIDVFVQNSGARRR